MTNTLSALRSAAKKGETAALEFAHLANDFLEEFAQDHADLPPRMQLSECITFLHNDLIQEGVARVTITDRMRVGRYWTRTRVKNLPIQFGYHHLRAMLGETDEETEQRINRVLEWMRINETFPKVEEVNDIVNGRARKRQWERARIALCKAARKVSAIDPENIWREAAGLVLARAAADEGKWDGEE